MFVRFSSLRLFALIAALMQFGAIDHALGDSPTTEPTTQPAYDTVLDSPMPALDLRSTTLETTLNLIRLRTGLRFDINWPALLLVDVKKDTPVTLAADDLSAKQTLQLVLRLAGKGKIGAGVGDPIIITTLDDLTAKKVPILPDPEISATLAEKLEHNLPTLQFKDNALADVLRMVSRESGLNLVTDWNSLSQAGVTAETPITGKIAEGKSLDWLKSLLKLGGTDVELEVVGNVVLISAQTRR